MVLADAVGVETDPIGALDLLEQVPHPLGRADVYTGDRVGHRGDEAVDAGRVSPKTSCRTGFTRGRSLTSVR